MLVNQHKFLGLPLVNEIPAPIYIGKKDLGG